MQSKGDCNIIIVGGGIAGLTLANILDRVDIDYVLLESHSSIAPKVGASVGLFPNGLRILDQIGCFEAVRNATLPEFAGTYRRNRHGRITKKVTSIVAQLSMRHGYGMHFFDRRQLLEILSENLRNKNRVLLNRKFISATVTEEGVRVQCDDGSTFDGTFVVGADGVHSAVRTSMTALAREVQPGYFDPREDKTVACYYKCLYGISEEVPGWIDGEQHLLNGAGHSGLVVSSPSRGRVYWFLWDKLPEAEYGAGISRYTKDDEEALMRKYYDQPITESVRYGRLFDHRTFSMLTPVHEVVYKKWFFKRMVTIGDSAHKVNPLTGQGANAAFESCAELVNALLRTRDRRGGSLQDLATAEVEQIFAEVQASREDRAHFIVKQANRAQALDAYEKPWLSTLIHDMIIPFVSDELAVGRSDARNSGAARIEALPVPHRPRAIPFDDELPSVPIGKSHSKAVLLLYLAIMGIVLYLTHKTWRMTFVPLGTWGEDGPAMSTRWFGDNTASKVLNAFASGLAMPMLSDGIERNLHLVYFLSQLVSPIMIWAVEGYRAGHRETPLALPVLFSAGMQLQGIGRLAPLYGILSALFTVQGPTGRAIPVEAARALLPAIVLGYIVPLGLMLTPTPNTGAWQHAVVLWQFAPPLVNLLLYFLTKVLGRWRRESQPAAEYEKEHGLDRYKNNDLSALKAAYTFAFWIQAAVHITTLAYAQMHPDVSIARTFWDLPSPFKPDWGLSTAGTICAFLRWDMVLSIASFTCSNLYSVWLLRRSGYIKMREVVWAVLAVVVGQVLVGSGATWVGLWYWRENKIARLALNCGVGSEPVRG